MTLTSDDLRQLSFAIGLDGAAMHTVDANSDLSTGIKLLFLALVLMRIGTMWIAVLVDVSTSLLVTLNSISLLGYRASAADGSDTVSTRRRA